MNRVRGRIASAITSRYRRSRPSLIALAIVCGALSPEAALAIDTAVGEECAPGIAPGADTGCSVAFLEFRDVRRAGDINSGPDLGGTGQPAINFTGSAGAAGDTWITVLDADAPLSSESPAEILIP